MTKERIKKRLERLEQQAGPHYIPLMHEAMTAARECDRAALETVRGKLSTLDEHEAAFVGRFIDAAQTTLDMEMTA
jgi:hypothetical protein